MLKKSPYDVILSRHITEKARTLEQLQSNESNPSVRKCKIPKYVFLVAKKANKQEIKQAIEKIYIDRKIKVISVNTITIKPKAKRFRGRLGKKAGFKKAIVSLESGDNIQDKV
ncbi:MAG: 50S ribosomal protein L23 [Candidatus Rhabdochlamydia sp.]|jgi:large subunit ribosomal protein L23|nr:large subunit ribosomal protein [Chlamydiota bacterium]